jgi:catechol 2,3-dioxygenase
VADLSRAEAFYRGTLGFGLMLGLGRGAAFLSAGGYHHHIGLNTWAGVGAPPPPQEAVGLRFFSIVLPDRRELERVIGSLRESGVAFKEKDGAVALRDPSGNGILLVAGRSPPLRECLPAVEKAQSAHGMIPPWERSHEHPKCGSAARRHRAR